MTETLKFSLELKEIPVVLENADGTKVDAYLRELTGKQRDSYLTGLSGRMKYRDGKVTGLSSFEGLQASLLSLCLVDKADGKLIGITRIQTFPAKVQEALFKAAQELSGLDDIGEEEAKND